MEKMAKIAKETGVLDKIEKKMSGGGHAQPPTTHQPQERVHKKKGGGMTNAGEADEDYAGKAAATVPCDVRMFSGCSDSQTSADVQNVASFGLPDSEGAGGACTNAMLSAIEEGGTHMTWIQLLTRMRAVLKTKKFSQIPQLSSSRPLDLKQRFDIRKDTSTRSKALLIGINYVGQQGQLSGCHNDVLAMKGYILTQGYNEHPDQMKVLMDDGRHEQPTSANIQAAMRWLVTGAQAGDSFFVHYSGHGGSMPDDDGDEKDGLDETMVPLDYQSAGQIRDDELFKWLVAPLPEGSELTVVMDCCHSGSIMDLPYIFTGTQSTLDSIEAGETAPNMVPNSNFDLKKVLKVAKELYEMSKSGNASYITMGEHAARAFGYNVPEIPASISKMF